MIDLEELRFRYSRAPELFRGVTMSLEAGNIYGLLGKNGAGKTTLLRLMAGLLFPRGGSVRLWGQDAYKRTPQVLSNTVFVPEEFYVPAISAREYIRVYAPFYPRFDGAILDRAMREFGLEVNENLGRLSYGQRKKFVIGFALATGARLLLLDEPTNGLDIPSKSQFRKILLGELSDERTFLVSTHQVRDLENVIDPIIILDEGRVILNASFGELGSKLTSRVARNAEDANGSLYSEQVPGGTAVIEPNRSGVEGEVDLELLFNACVTQPEAVQRVLAATGSTATSTMGDRNE